MIFLTEILGNDLDIKIFNNYFKEEISIIFDEIVKGNVILLNISESSELNDILDNKRLQLKVYNGFCKITNESYQSLKLGNTFEKDKNGNVRTFVTATSSGRSAAFASISKGSKDEVKISKILELKPKVQSVFEMIENEGFTWVNMYRILELLEAEFRQELKDINRTKRDLFKHTANSVKTLGMEARHGAENTKPPTKPMPKSDAINFIKELINMVLNV